MSENIGRVMDAVSKVKEVHSDSFKSMASSDAEGKAVGLFNAKEVMKQNVGQVKVENFGPKADETEEVSQEPTVLDLINRVDVITKDLSADSEIRSETAMNVWDRLGTKKEALGGTTEMDAYTKANEVVREHKSAESRRGELESSIIDNLAKENFAGVTSGIVNVRWESYADIDTVTPELLKTDPRFSEYRADLVKAVADLAKETAPINVKKDLMASVKSLWKRASIGLKYAGNLQFKPETKTALYEQMDMAKSLAHHEDFNSTLPDLQVAKDYLGDFGRFQNIAQLVIDNQAVLDAMPIIADDMEANQGQKFATQIGNSEGATGLIDEALKENKSRDIWDDAHKEEAGKNEVKELELKLAREALAARLSKEGKNAAELDARKKVSDLELQFIQLSELSTTQGEMASKAAFVLAELQDSQAKIDDFNASIKDGNVPDALKFMSEDVGKDLDAFIASGGKLKGEKGSAGLAAIRKLIGTTDNPGDLIKVVNDLDNPQGFLRLNLLKDAQNPNRQVETGIVAVPAEDGTIQFRFATREGGKLEINQEIPVVNLKPEQISIALTAVDSTQLSLDNAQAMLKSHQSKYELAKDSKAVDPALRAKYKGLVATSESQVKAFTAELVKSKAVLAEQLKATNANKTLGGAFKQMSDAQSEVAQEFFSADFNEVVRQLAGELKMDPDKVTAEVLATVVVEANHASEQADQMAQYLNIAKNKGALEAKVVNDRLPYIENIAFDFARLQEQEEIANKLTGDAGVAAKKQHLKARRALDKKAEAFGEILNEDFKKAVPAPLHEKKGLKAVEMSNAQFKQGVKDTLVDPALGFDSAQFLKKTDGSLRRESVAERVRADLPFSSEVKFLVRKAADALVVIDSAEATSVLRSALDGGDIQGFLDRANEIRESSTTEQFSTRQAEARLNLLKEQLASPEGIIGLMGASEEGWREAIAVADEDNAIGVPVYEALLKADTPAAETVKAEAAARFGRIVAPIIAAAGSPASWPEGISPLSARKDLIPQVQFLSAATTGPAKVYWESVLDQINMEKKMTEATE